MSPSRQAVYKAHLASTNKPLRPIFTHLNGDNSWLMSFPRPEAEQASSRKAYFHIVYEPWLRGDTPLFRAWVFNIALSATAATTDAQGVEDIIREIEDAAASCIPAPQAEVPAKDGPYHGNIDAIMLTFHYLDHVHEATLRTFDENIPVIATREAAAVVQPWKHFKTVSLSHDLDISAKTWKSPKLHPEYLPEWLTVLRLPGHATLNFCTTLIWTHETETGEEVHETILSSPHGMCLDQAPLDAFLNAEPKTEMLTLFHGLKESYGITGQTTYGAKGGLALYRKIGGTKNWIMTHDSDLSYSGLLLYLVRVRDVPRSLEWALEAERERGEGLEADVPNICQVPNGGAVVLQ
ncbi:hypothetical protein FHETE_834 [Fusarium heterosporum]|uniref:Uncharacterized protein n=1 Tax=Fusarium heterosporum TaxID=42747 RepID=A0A8H5U422_FUSHE|nr:hypothetical protein FHETE_834 [Fusarium heterosporum]